MMCIFGTKKKTYPSSSTLISSDSVYTMNKRRDAVEKIKRTPFPAANSEKNKRIYQHTKSVETRDQVLQSMQQKFDCVCKQLNNIKIQLGAWAGMSIDKKDPIALPKIKSIGCQCLFCDHHKDNSLFNGLTGERNLDNSLFKGLSGEEFQGRCVSDSKTTDELEDTIRTKNTRITRLRKDMLILKQKKMIAKLKDIIHMKTIPKMVGNTLFNVENTTSLQSSDSDCSQMNPVAVTHNDVLSKKSSLKLGQEDQVLKRHSNTKQISIMIDNPISDMKSTTSPASSDSDCSPRNPVAETHKNVVSKNSFLKLGREDQVLKRQSNTKQLPAMADNPLSDMESTSSPSSSDSDCSPGNPVAKTCRSSVSKNSSLELGRGEQVLERHSNLKQIPVMIDNPLFDMESTPSCSSSDSDCSPRNCVPTPRTYNNFLYKNKSLKLGQEDQVLESMQQKSDSSIYSVEQTAAKMRDHMQRAYAPCETAIQTTDLVKVKQVLLQKALPLYVRVLQRLEKWHKSHLGPKDQVLHSIQQNPDSCISTAAKIDDHLQSTVAQRETASQTINVYQVFLQKAWQFYLSVLRMFKGSSETSGRTTKVAALLRSLRSSSDCFGKVEADIETGDIENKLEKKN